MTGTTVLLVEGNDDKHVLMHLCGNHHLRLDEIKEHGGIDNLLESFPVRLKAGEDGDIVGVIVDADTNLESRWQGLRDRLNTLGYQNVSAAPEPNGTVIDPPEDTLLPRVGIWIMPNNQTTGILEDFLLFLVPRDSQLLAHVETSVQNIPNDQCLFSPLARPKAIIHTWLSWQREPGKPFGTAIMEKFLDPNVVEVELLIAWLRRLYRL